MKLCLDTNAYSDWRKTGMWNEWICRAESLYIPAVVLGELRAGFSLGNQGAVSERRLNQFLKFSVVSVALLGDTTSVNYATLKKHLKEQGTPLPVNDIWIAASVLELGCVLLTSDKHFDRLPQVRVIGPGDSEK